MPLLSLKLYHLNNNQLTENTDLSGSALATNRKNAKGLSKKNQHIAEPILVIHNLFVDHHETMAPSLNGRKSGFGFCTFTFS